MRKFKSVVRELADGLKSGETTLESKPEKPDHLRDLGWFLVAVVFLALGASSALEFCLWLIGG